LRRTRRPRSNAASTADWLRYLTSDERERAHSLRAGHNEFKRLRLSTPARRAAWLAHGEGRRGSDGGGGGGDVAAQQTPESRHALFKRLQAAHNEYHRLYRFAQRQMARKAEAMMAARGSEAPLVGEEVLDIDRTGWDDGGVEKQGAGDGRRRLSWVRHLAPKERARADFVRPAYNEYMRLRLNVRARRDAWLAKDDRSGRRRAYYERLRPAVQEYFSLYRKAARARDKAEQKAEAAAAAAAKAQTDKQTPAEHEQLDDADRSWGAERKDLPEELSVPVPGQVVESDIELGERFRRLMIRTPSMLTLYR
jgi:biotin carboxyl carrier protein